MGKNLDFRIDRYEVTMRRCHDPNLDLRIENGRFIVRHWDGMDGVWTDVSDGSLDADGALALWEGHTAVGTRNIDFRQIDYYRIFPADSVMLWSDERSMFDAAAVDAEAPTLRSPEAANADDPAVEDAVPSPPSSGWRDR